MSEKQPDETLETLTSEEVAIRRQELINYYTEALPLLKIQCEYEEIKTKIDVARTTGLKARIMFAEMSAPPAPEGTTSSKKKE